MKKGISLLCIVVLILGCKNSRRAQDIVGYVEDTANGLHKTVTVAEFQYTIQYKPASYILKQENLPVEAEAERAKQLEGMAWFNIGVRIKNYTQSPLRYKVNGLAEYGKRQDYYLNEAAKDIRLIYGRDTLSPEAYWFENNQNLAAHETLIAGFKLPDNETVPTRSMQFTFYDQVFGNGIIKAIIKKESLKAIPVF